MSNGVEQFGVSGKCHIAGDFMVGAAHTEFDDVRVEYDGSFGVGLLLQQLLLVVVQ